MRSLLLFSVLILSYFSSAQNMILNPGFENHALTTACYTNQTDAQVTAALDNVTAFYFGSQPGIDIGVSSACYAGGANSGTTHIVLARLFNEQMSEAFSMDLTTPIVAGNTYSISFYAANSNVVLSETLLIGVSGSQTSFGTQASAIPLGTNTLYTQYSATFVAPVSGAYLTVQPQLSDEFWFGLDDFYLENTCASTSGSSLITVCDSYTVPSGDETYTFTGTYYDTIPNMSGCDSILTIDVTVNTVDATATQTDDITIMATSASASQYQWVDCDNGYADIPGATSQTYVATVNGNYAVIVTENGCSDTSACVVIDQVGIEELTSGQKELVKIIDLTGRETNPRKNQVLIYIYSDGTTERVFEFE